VLWTGFLAIGCAGSFAYELIADQYVRDVLYLLVGVYGVAGIVLGVHVNRPALSRPWYLMAVGQFLWVTGDAIYTWFEDVLDIAPFPSIADAFYLGAYPVLVLGLCLLIRGRRPQRDRGALLDSAIVTAGLGLLSWVVLLRATIATSEDSVVAAAVAAAYPVGDIMLAGALVWMLTSPGGRSASLRLLLGAITLLIVGDTLYLARSLFGAGDSYSIDFLWLLGYVLWGTAALHPSVAGLSRPCPDGDVQFRRGRLVAMTLATLIAPGTLAVQRVFGLRLDVLAVVIASVLMFLLVVVRMKLSIDQIASANTQLEQLREELAFQATHDSLTDLPNRARAMRLLHQALSRAQRSGGLVALLFIDLDGFKAVNDTHGHRAGDEVLRSVSERLQAQLRAGDTAARLGGDEFVVLLETVDGEASAVAVAQRLIEAVSAPIRLGTGDDARIGASIGISFNGDGGTDAENLLHEADLAAYRAKAEGRGRVELFSAALSAELARRIALEAAIRGAIEANEFVLHYQPIVNVSTGNVDGYEALLRWERPGVGILLPADFIPVAESSDLIFDVDRWVLTAATRQLAAWNRETGTRRLRLAVNVSGRHVNSPLIRDDVTNALRDHAVDPRQLVLEITETVLVDDRLAVENLQELRRLGVVLALDDFGTGYSTLTQLSRLPVDFLKVDRSYLDTSTPERWQLLRLTVQVAHAFGLPVVGEGVENQQQLDLLRELGVEYAQGFHLGRPLPVGQLDPPVPAKSDERLPV